MPKLIDKWVYLNRAIEARHFEWSDTTQYKHSGRAFVFVLRIRLRGRDV
ncbi:MAG: hypothetical protein AB7P24_00655 [Nitrospira sp.]